MDRRWRRTMILLVVVGVSALVFAGVGRAADEEGQGTLTAVHGKVSIRFKTQGDAWYQAEEYMPVSAGDRIRTEGGSSAEILLDDGSLIRVAEDSEIEIQALEADSWTQTIVAKIFLKAGRLLANVVKMANGRSSFEVHTLTAVAAVRGTEFLVETGREDRSGIGVYGGKVMVTGKDPDGKMIKGSEVMVGPDRQTTVSMWERRPIPPMIMRAQMLMHKRRMLEMRLRAEKLRERLRTIIQERMSRYKGLMKGLHPMPAT